MEANWPSVGYEIAHMNVMKQMEKSQERLEYFDLEMQYCFHLEKYRYFHLSLMIAVK